MGLDAEAMVDVIVGGTTGYLVEFLPIGAFIIGLVIAFVVMEWLVYLIVDLRYYNKYLKDVPDYDFRTLREDRRKERNSQLEF